MTLSLRIIITLLALVAGIAILGAIVIVPSWRGLATLARSIEQERIRIEKTAVRVRELRQTTEDIALIKKRLPEIEKLLVGAGEEIQLFSDLEKRSSALGLAETLGLSETKRETGGIATLPLEIELQGSFAKVLRFIAEVETAPLLLPLYVIDMRTDPQSQGGSTQFKSRLRGKVYVKNF